MRDESQLWERAMEVRPAQRGRAMVTVVSFSVDAGKVRSCTVKEKGLEITLEKNRVLDGDPEHVSGDEDPRPLLRRRPSTVSLPALLAISTLPDKTRHASVLVHSGLAKLLAELKKLRVGSELVGRSEDVKQKWEGRLFFEGEEKGSGGRVEDAILGESASRIPPATLRPPSIGQQSSRIVSKL